MSYRQKLKNAQWVHLLPTDRQPGSIAASYGGANQSIKEASYGGQQRTQRRPNA